MSIKTQALELAIAILKRGIGITTGKRASQISAQIAEQLTPIVQQDAGIGTLKFFCPGKLPEWRARTLLTKEPDTIEWINGFDKTDVLWDVGANVGVYSLYAALRGVSVQAFEPAPANYYLLSRNIEINGFDDRITSFCIAFNDETRVDTFYMSETDVGSALNSFGVATDWKGENFSPKFKQAMLGFTIDDFIRQFTPPFPNHIKIDVDGIEKKIVNGATQTLSDSRLKSALIELNIDWEDSSEIVSMMESMGFILQERARAAIPGAGRFSGVYNHIFVRTANPN